MTRHIHSFQLKSKVQNRIRHNVNARCHQVVTITTTIGAAMISRIENSPRWSTASFGDTADTSPMELSVLGDHMARCSHLPGTLFSWQCTAEAVHRAVASRFVTTLTLATVVLAVTSLIW